MTVRQLDVIHAELRFDASYTRPAFDLFESRNSLGVLFKYLAPHGLRLADLRTEAANGNIGEQHLNCSLFNYLMNIKIRTEGVEIFCSQLPRDHVSQFDAAIVDVLKAIKEGSPTLAFGAFSTAIGLHGKLQGQNARDYLATLTTTPPEGLGPSTGSGSVFYFGPEGDRLLSSITADVSIVVRDGLYLRISGTWDPAKVTIDTLGQTTKTFVNDALANMNLQSE
jgi:hypothetical protein